MASLILAVHSDVREASKSYREASAACCAYSVGHGVRLLGQKDVIWAGHAVHYRVWLCNSSCTKLPCGYPCSSSHGIATVSHKVATVLAGWLCPSAPSAAA
jgi:hypothetical protein